MSAPGIPGAWRRRLVAASVVALGLLDVFLAAKRHPVLRIGPIDNAFHYSVVHGSRYVLLVGALSLLAATRGLLHGKRQAWEIALGAAGLTLVAHGFKRVDVVGMAATVSVMAILLATTASFPARSDPSRARQGVAWLVLGELAVFVYGSAGLYLLDTSFKQPAELREALSQTVALLFLQPANTVEPVTLHGRWFVDSVRVMALAVLGIGIWFLLRPVAHRIAAGKAERARVTSLLEEYATNSLSYFHLLDDKSYYIADDGRSFIGYRVVGSTAVALGEPVGERQSCRDVTASFARFCDLNGWSFCFHQVTPTGALYLRETGLSALKLGEEAIVSVTEFSLAGKSFKHLRNTTNRLDRDAFTASVLPRPLSEHDLDQLEEISDEWLADGKHRERTFTLGAFSREYMRETEVVAVRSPSGRIEAFANIIPSYRSASGNFDLMRRRPDAPDGVMDYLFVRMIALFKERGFEGMNLGFAPLSNIEGSGVVARALRVLYERGGRAFNFQGLRAFKEKWHPVWEPRYLVYRSDIQLPQLALAVARAGERHGGLALSLGRRPKERRSESA